MKKTKKTKWDPVNELSLLRKSAGFEKALREQKKEMSKKQELKQTLVALGVDLQRLKREPEITSMMEEYSLCGLEGVLEAMRLSADDGCAAFLEKYEELTPEQQEIVPWEAIAQLAGVDGRQLLGATILAIREHARAQVSIAALTSHAAVTQATVKYALMPDGYLDRRMIHQALGFLPTPKGQTINLNVPSVLPPEDEKEVEVAAEDIDMNELFPDLATTQSKLLND